ncbi:helix-turn-helix domain-containing protein [Furfurilactobacillus sp. WILCCON 0119]|uniref:helix-turn-helix domain-containing protein n=1 Tax=Furfurilactobacillus entadae TaxID=2922307 RepID=UPI0035EC615A
MLGVLLKEQRLNRNMTLRQLAATLNERYGLNLSAGMLSRYENGTNVSTGNLFFIADFFEIDLTSFAKTFVDQRRTDLAR